LRPQIFYFISKRNFFDFFFHLLFWTTKTTTTQTKQQRQSNNVQCRFKNQNIIINKQQHSTSTSHMPMSIDINVYQTSDRISLVNSICPPLSDPYEHGKRNPIIKGNSCHRKQIKTLSASIQPWK
jgi:hypothetical protein